MAFRLFVAKQVPEPIVITKCKNHVYKKWKYKVLKLIQNLLENEKTKKPKQTRKKTTELRYLSDDI